MNIKKDDQVEVITGDDKGTPSARKIAKVLRVLPEKNKIVVEGVNRVYKHLKPGAKNQQGGRLSKEMPIDVSNVMLYCPSCNRGVRVGKRFTESGLKERYCKSCGLGLGRIGPEKESNTIAFFRGKLIMRKTDFLPLLRDHPHLGRALDEIAAWTERHPNRPFDSREMLGDIRDLNPADLSFALTLLVRKGLLKKEFRVRAPTDRQLVAKPFGSLKEIPRVLEDSRHESFDSGRGEVVMLYQETSL